MRKTKAVVAGKGVAQNAHPVIDRKGNQRVIKAITAGNINVEKQGESNQIQNEDKVSGLLGTKNIVPAPFDPLQLSKIVENSSELGQVIEAMVINIEGFGGRFLPRIAKEDREKFQDELEKEFEQIDFVFNHINPDYDLVELRKRTRRDIESNGNGYWEVIRDPSEEVYGMYHVESHSIRISKLDEEDTVTNVPVLTKDFRIVEKPFRKRFRRFIQVRGQKAIWFKEYGDPRIINKKTGEVMDENLEPNMRATELIHFRVFTSTSSYGIPRFIGNLFSLFGSRSADEINFLTFQNNNIPAMAVIVNNGQLTDGTIERLEEFVEAHVKRSNNRSAFLILEAEAQSEDDEGTNAMKIDIKDLTKTQQNDQLFQEYDKNNAEKIRRSFRLPPIFVGKSDDYTRATAESSRRLADEQIFEPERKTIDFQINRLLLDLGIKLWWFKSNSANVTDDSDLVSILSSTEKAGGLTPNLAREILSDILNREIPPYDANKVTFDPEQPFSMAMAKAVQRQDGNAPNQGQLERPRNGGGDEESEKFIKWLENPEKNIDNIIEFSDKVEKFLEDTVYGANASAETD